MTAHGSTIGATVPAPSASNSGAPALVTAARRTMMHIHVFSALFWIAMFTNHTTQMLLVNEKEDWHAIGWRASMNVLAFFLCLPLGKVIARTLNLRLSQRILAIGGAAVPIAFVYACVGAYVWQVVLKNPPMPYSVLVGLIVQSQYNLILFLMWSAFCSVILYAAQLQDRERTLLQAQVLAREAELKMLRYQINPHFLFNTLNAVSALIVTGQALAADAMISKLARFFRNALSRESNAKVTLTEELRVQLEYLNIELTRFPERLSWSTQIEPGLDNALVPHLILQPLVENAIKHGVARTSAPVELKISVARRGGELFVTVENGTGAGLKPDLQREAGEGVGLANVARRLENFYGSDAGMRAAQRDGRFTVDLRMPLELTL
ncbi:MAG TPA: histidine kinase [Steroidobacteraceae bacterium]|jgi:two-component sensor histidine kinase|nr:histidine kinase [Steroidobacteraceae bacterium]